MYDFQMKKNTGLKFEKVSENSYIIGTRKVQAKVNNGILLLRVGGGFMDIDNFIKQYGEVELAKQHRQEDKEHNNQERLSLDSLQAAKNAAKKIKKGTGRASA